MVHIRKGTSSDASMLKFSKTSGTSLLPCKIDENLCVK